MKCKINNNKKQMTTNTTNHELHHDDEHEPGKKNSFPNLCIPRVHSSITKEVVFEIINKYSLGSIAKIDVIKKKGARHNMVFIYFNEWYHDNLRAIHVKERLMSGKDIKIIYDDPWYWKISALKI
jgi:hypothetical protein